MRQRTGCHSTYVRLAALAMGCAGKTSVGGGHSIRQGAVCQDIRGKLGRWNERMRQPRPHKI